MDARCAYKTKGGDVEDRVWSEYVRSARLRLGWTQRDVEAQADAYLAALPEVPKGARVTQEDVSHIEKGGRPTTAKLRTLVQVLHLDLMDTALAYIGIDPEDTEAREWKPATPASDAALVQLFAAQPTPEEVARLVDVLAMLRFWEEGAAAVGNMAAVRRDRRVRRLETRK